MSLLRILLAYTSEDVREEIPTVLLLTRDGDVAQQMADRAPAEFHRIELLETRGGQRLRKQAPVVGSVESLADFRLRAGSDVDATAALIEERDRLQFIAGRVTAERDDLASKLTAARAETAELLKTADAEIARWKGLAESLQRGIDDQTALKLSAASSGASALVSPAAEPAAAVSSSDTSEILPNPQNEGSAGASSGTLILAETPTAQAPAPVQSGGGDKRKKTGAPEVKF